jgi:ribosomal protein S18 acetylase RimI-like enzyme
MPPSPLTIRPATPADAEALTTLARRLTEFPLPPWRSPDEISSADAREMIDVVAEKTRANEVFIAERRDPVDHSVEIVGCLHMLTTTDFFGRAHAHVSVIATSEAAEGTGVGRALLALAEQWARERGMSLLTLNVFDRNTRARRFYEQAGFQPETVKYAKAL